MGSLLNHTHRHPVALSADVLNSTLQIGPILGVIAP
jgi:hypothetical protein